MKIIVAQYNEQYNQCGERYNKKEPTALNIIDKCSKIWMKADSALLKGGKPMFLPDWTQECSATLCLWARIKHMGKSIPARFAHRYYDQIGVGVDFTAEDVLRALRKAGEPWDMAKSFDGSAIIGNSHTIEQTDDEQQCAHQTLTLALTINNEKKTEITIEDVGHTLGEMIEAVSRFFTLREGDYLFLSPNDNKPQAVGINDHIACMLNGERLTEFNVK